MQRLGLVPPFEKKKEKKVLEKVEEIERELPIYVAIMNKMNVCRRNTSPILVSSEIRSISYYCLSTLRWICML
jgi:hypothetical protein